MIEVRPLRPDDSRQTFSSGDPDLDRFFHKYAGQSQFRLHIGTTYVAIRDGDILGFATLTATSITIADLPKAARKRLPSYPLPALRLARLAVAEAAQGQGIGKLLLRTTFAIAHEMADRTGCVAVVVDAKPDAVAFYEKYGFEPFEMISGELGDRPKPLPMFLPLGSVPRKEDDT
jgi:GNAT superfamily N-acetyltransferase